MENINYSDILLAKKAYNNNENVYKLLSKKCKNNSEVIQISYDLQSGSYIDFFLKNEEIINDYTTQLSDIIDKYIHNEHQRILDVGTGELTTLSCIINKLKNKPKSIYAFDISWSRLYKGLDFSKIYMDIDFSKLQTFVADINEMPLLNKSINITITSHALEPNGSNLKEIMRELFRVTVDKLILFEPCYEINSEEGKKRMDYYGYIKDIDLVVEELKGILEEKIVIKNPLNYLNPTVCYIITPPINDLEIKNIEEKNIFTFPGTNFKLTNCDDSFYFSNDLGLCFPIIKSIPVLLSKNYILASSLIKSVTT